MVRYWRLRKASAPSRMAPRSRASRASRCRPTARAWPIGPPRQRQHADREGPAAEPYRLHESLLLRFVRAGFGRASGFRGRPAEREARGRPGRTHRGPTSPRERGEVSFLPRFRQAPGFLRAGRDWASLRPLLFRSTLPQARDTWHSRRPGRRQNPPVPEELGLVDSTMIRRRVDDRVGHLIVSADHRAPGGIGGRPHLTWVITGLLTVTAALSYGELAAMMRRRAGSTCI